MGKRTQAKLDERIDRRIKMHMKALRARQKRANIRRVSSLTALMRGIAEFHDLRRAAGYDLGKLLGPQNGTPLKIDRIGLEEIRRRVRQNFPEQPSEHTDPQLRGGESPR